MSQTFLVAFDDASHGVRRQDLVDALRRDWPNAVFSDQPEVHETRDVTWTYDDDEDQLEGHSHVDGTCIYLESSAKMAARFALWYRKLVPAEIDLVFCDEGYSFDGLVVAGMSIDEVAAIADGE